MVIVAGFAVKTVLQHRNDRREAEGQDSRR
jgi:hypothetical protein